MNTFQLPALLPQVPIVELRTGAPTQFFTDYMTSISQQMTAAVNALNAAVAALQTSNTAAAAQAQANNTTAQQAAAAQAAADSAGGSPAQSGDAMATMNVFQLAGWTAGPLVNLAGVVAGTLTIPSAGPYQSGTTGVSQVGSWGGNWRIQEIVLGVETTITTGFWEAQNLGPDLGYIVIFFNDTDTSTLSFVRASTGAVSYRLDMISPDVDVTGVTAYLYVRRV